MLVSTVNDIRIYNLSAGKSLPDWLSDRKRRKLNQQDDDMRRRIELIQDFEMPDVSTCICMSPDGQYIFVGGTYKPRLRCYDVHEMSMKFERCVDAEIIKMLVLSDGYEKLALLQDERYIELHVQHGAHLRLRLPKFGRDIAYYAPHAELLVCASGGDIYRLNLELGRFMQPMNSEALSTTCCAVNQHHYLFVNGTNDCRLESWDLRSRERVGLLDCAVECSAVGGAHVPLHISSVAWRDALHLAVGTSGGECLLYDIRSRKPLLIKNTHNELAVKRVHYVRSADTSLVATLDEKCVKLWHENDGRPYASIEPDVPLNDLHFVDGTGLMMIACEQPKLFTYYLPSVGPAPRWCAFLDNITDELEETTSAVYDDYKFVTASELEALGLSKAIGTSLLRAYMHGYFVDARLYTKARQLSDPFAYEQYRQRRIQERLAAERSAHVSSAPTQKLPRINRQLAARLMAEQAADTAGMKGRRKQQRAAAASLLLDDRFTALFADPAFEVDKESEEYTLINPTLDKLNAAKQMRYEKQLKNHESSDDDDQTIMPIGIENVPSTDIERENANVAQQLRVKLNEKVDAAIDRKAANRLKSDVRRRTVKAERTQIVRGTVTSDGSAHKLRLVQVADGAHLLHVADKPDALSSNHHVEQFKTMTLAERLVSGEHELGDTGVDDSVQHLDDGVQVTFKLSRKSKSERQSEQSEEHKTERRKVRRSAHEIERQLPKKTTMKHSRRK